MTRFPIFSREVGSLVFDLELISLKSLAHSQLSPNTEAPESWGCSLHSDLLLPSMASAWNIYTIRTAWNSHVHFSFEVAVKNLLLKKSVT